MRIKLTLSYLASIVLLNWGPDVSSEDMAASSPANINGIWQANSAAYWNIERHSAAHPPLEGMGALGATPPSQGVVENNALPYQPWAVAKRALLYNDRLNLDPARKCFMPGIPRASYMPFPFQIVQSSDHIFIAYQFAGASRTIYMNRPHMDSPADSWMGLSKGHWDGNTLVVEVTHQVPDTWFDRSGNFHSDALTVIERYTPYGPNHLIYEATIYDEKVFTAPWKIRLPLYRRIEENIQLLDFRCIEFAEEMMYGPITKKSKGDGN